jgi:hypothetical protein
VKKGSIFMPAGLFSLYIGCMALWEKNPENSKVEKFLFWLAKIMGAGSVGWEIHSLYVYIPIVISEQVISGLAVLRITISIDLLVLGIALLIYYKKSLDVFSRPWIFVSFSIFWILKILENNIYHDPALTQAMSELLVLIALIGGWFVYRKKYPEEFGLKS